MATTTAGYSAFLHSTSTWSPTCCARRQPSAANAQSATRRKRSPRIAALPRGFGARPVAGARNDIGVGIDPARHALPRGLVGILQDRAARGEARRIVHEEHGIGGLGLQEQKLSADGYAGGRRQAGGILWQALRAEAVVQPRVHADAHGLVV